VDAPPIRREGSTEATGQVRQKIDGDVLDLESGVPLETVHALMQAGHRVKLAQGPDGG
jgi:hypothetical protein